jgi:hypothetical protein
MTTYGMPEGIPDYASALFPQPVKVEPFQNIYQITCSFTMINSDLKAPISGIQSSRGMDRGGGCR